MLKVLHHYTPWKMLIGSGGGLDYHPFVKEHAHDSGAMFHFHDARVR